MSNVCSSLPVVMEYVKEFGRFSGLGINWEKSMLMPLDPLPDPLPHMLSHFKVVSSIKYLGITMLDSSQSYIVDNIFPLLIRFQNQSKTWTKLPFIANRSYQFNKNDMDASAPLFFT